MKVKQEMFLHIVQPEKFFGCAVCEIICRK